MITRVFGKVIENKHGVDYKQKEILDKDGNTKTVYTGKPALTKESNVKEWVELCSYKGEPRYNTPSYVWMSYSCLNISETEEVKIEREIFRADLNECHLRSNKVIEEVDADSLEANQILKEQTKLFNKTMIKSNERMKSYCDLHKLCYENTDCIELFKLLFPNDEYVIEDGVMKVKEKITKFFSDEVCVHSDALISTITRVCEGSSISLAIDKATKTVI